MSDIVYLKALFSMIAARVREARGREDGSITLEWILIATTAVVAAGVAAAVIISRVNEQARSIPTINP